MVGGAAFYGDYSNIVFMENASVAILLLKTVGQYFVENTAVSDLHRILKCF